MQEYVCCLVCECSRFFNQPTCIAKNSHGKQYKRRLWPKSSRNLGLQVVYVRRLPYGGLPPTCLAGPVSTVVTWVSSTTSTLRRHSSDSHGTTNHQVATLTYGAYAWASGHPYLLDDIAARTVGSADVGAMGVQASRQRIADFLEATAAVATVGHLGGLS